MKLDLYVETEDSSNIEDLQFTTDEKVGDERWVIPQKYFGTLRVTFKNGARYVYDKVELKTITAIILSDSVGSAFNEYIIKGKYDYKRT